MNVIVDCLNKINLQNKKLLEIVESITVKIKSVSEANKNSSEVVSDPTIVPAAEGALSDVNNSLEKLEQNVNQNVLICRGANVESLIKKNLKLTVSQAWSASRAIYAKVFVVKK